MTYDNAEFWIKAGIIIWNIGLTAALWMRKPGLEAQESVRSLKSTVGEIEADMRVMKESMKHLPTRDEVAELARALTGLEVDNKAQTNVMQTMREQLVRIEQFLMNNR
jgi:Protein of unknown function (DUF2730)